VRSKSTGEKVHDQQIEEHEELDGPSRKRLL